MYMILSTQELDVIDLFLEGQCESVSFIQQTVHLNNECWWLYNYEWYFLDEDYRTWETLYESILLWYWKKFDYFMWEYKCYINHWYYDYLYNHCNDRNELQRYLDSLTKEQAIEIYNTPYAMYFIRKFNLNFNI